MTSKVLNVKSNISKNRIDASNSIDSNKNKSLPIEEVIPDISVNNSDDCSNEPDVFKINDSNNFFWRWLDAFSAWYEIIRSAVEIFR